MKKFLSVILSLMMAISCFAVAPGVAMADNTILTPYSIALNQTLSVTFNCVLDEDGYRETCDDEFYYTYTPTESDYYQLTITNYYVDYSDISGSTSSDTYIRISDSNDSYINSGSVNVLKNTCLTAAYLEAGQKYYFKITCYGAYDTKAPYTLQLSLTKHEHTFTITSGEYYTYYDCDVCDLYYSEENACTHTSTTTKGASSATYFTQGYTGDTVCSRCGATISKGKSTKKKAPSLSSIGSSKKKQVSVYWTSVSGAKGYEIQYSTSKSMKSAKKVKVKKGASYSSTLKKLKSKKTYYVRVRAYKTSNGKKVYSAWSSVKKVKVK